MRGISSSYLLSIQAGVRRQVDECGVRRHFVRGRRLGGRKRLQRRHDQKRGFDVASKRLVLSHCRQVGESMHETRWIAAGMRENCEDI